LGLDGEPYYDAVLREKETIQKGLNALPHNYAEARLIEQSLTTVRLIREKHSIPPDLGYVRETVRIALKIFGELRGKKIDGSGPIVDALLARGAVLATDVPDLIVTEKELKFHDYTFTMDDLERMTRAEIKKYYPSDICTSQDKPVEDVADVLEHGIKKNPEAAAGFKTLINKLAKKNDDAIDDLMTAIIHQARL